VTGGEVGNHLGDEERIETGCTIAIGKTNYFLFEGIDAANTSSPNHSDAVEVFLFRFYTGIGNGLLGGNQGKLGKQVVFTGIFLFEVVVGVVILDLAGKRRLELGRVKACNRTGTAYPADHGFPGFWHGLAQWGNGSKACYNDSF